MPVKARTVLALDWNGTVVDDAERTLLALRAAGAPAPGSTAELRDGFLLPLAIWLARLGVPAGERAAVELRWNAELARRPAPLSPGALDLLEWCVGRPVEVQVVTGARRAVVDADARRLGIRHLLHGITGAAHPKAAVLRRLQLRPVVYVGDTEYDIDQARAAGAVAVAYAGGYRPEQALRDRRPDRLVRDLAEVVDVLTALTGPAS